MTEFAADSPLLTIEQLSDLRGKTQVVSELLRKQLEGHLGTIRSIFAPSRLLGKHVRSGSREQASEGDRAFDALKERYSQLSGKPFSLPRDIGEDPLSIEGRLDLQPWAYRHELDDGKAVTMSSPVRWILSYRSGYTPSELQAVLASKETKRNDDARRFVCSAIALDQLLTRRPEIVRLLTALRYDVSIDHADGLGELPIVTLSSCLASFRPADALIRTATQFSGVDTFVELINLDAVKSLRDPLQQRIESILGLPTS
jgi:hypothetical protein